VDFGHQTLPVGEAKNVSSARSQPVQPRQFDNSVSNLDASFIDPNTGQIINPGDFGRITSTSNNPRLIQLALKFNF
jgi:hypothetical protein